MSLVGMAPGAEIGDSPKSGLSKACADLITLGL